MAAEIQRLEMEVRYLRELLRQARIAKYGPASEKLSDQQLELLELEPGVRPEEIQAESEQAQLKLPLRSAARQEGHGRAALPAHLPRVERIIPCLEQECICGHCGGTKALIGYESCEQLDFEPAKYFVRVTKREKRACQHCPQQGVVSAPAPVQIIDKSLASDRLIIETIVSKYLAHQPLYRQSAILLRDTTIELSPNTLCGWVMRVGELLRPIAAAMAQELLAGDYLQADETPVDVQLRPRRDRKDKQRKNHQAYLWQYSRPGGTVVFNFQLGRGREGPKAFLGQYQGLLQTDGYAAYDEVGGAKIVYAGCWAHARRYFFKALQAQPKDLAAIKLVATIDELFALDAQARQEGCSIQERDQLRQQKARPLLESMLEQVVAAKATALPQSLLAKACHYTLAQWTRLSRFLDHPVLELSTNLAENAMRPIALGRKNWLHFGSPKAGVRIAAILSVLETCRRLKLSARDYLSSILPGLADFPIRHVNQLTPAAWAKVQKTS